jgi:hypothetical protein
MLRDGFEIEVKVEGLGLSIEVLTGVVNTERRSHSKIKIAMMSDN